MGGMRYYFSEGDFDKLNRRAFWNSSTKDEEGPWFIWMDFYYYDTLLWPEATKLNGYSVRCIKD